MGTAAILFAIAAVGGAIMAAMRLGGRALPPLALAVVHGLVAAVGLVTLIIAAKGAGASGMAVVALVGFVIAALGGAVMLFAFHLKQRALPIPLMLVHAGVAVISFVVLLIRIFARPG